MHIQGLIRVKMRNTHLEQMFSALHPKADSSQTSRHVRKVPILLQKSVASDGCPSAILLRAAGFDLPALTLSTQLQRYAMHRTSAGGGRATNAANRRRF